MAFEAGSDRTKNIKHALKKDVQEESNNLLDIKNKIVLEHKEPKELKKQYTFTLYPSTKNKADKIAKEHNYSSTSSFINDILDNL